MPRAVPLAGLPLQGGVVHHDVASGADVGSLDIGPPQIVTEMATRGAPRSYHHLALVRLRDALWSTLDAEGVRSLDDLAVEVTVPHQRGAEVPLVPRPLHMMRPLSGATNAAILATAEAWGAIRGAQSLALQPAAAGFAPAIWYYADTAHARFGKEAHFRRIGAPQRFEGSAGLIRAREHSDDEEPSWRPRWKECLLRNVPSGFTKNELGQAETYG